MKKTTNSTQDSIRRFIDSLTEFAENVMEHCRDRYGSKETPLLTDGFHLKTGEPVKWEKYVTSNLACQQNFLRTLDGLEALTGEPKYEKYAREWISYALKELQDPESGMLHWGGHTSYDLLEDKPLIGNHELKCVYPYYSFLYRVDPKATSLLIEGFWNKHVKNWSNLLFNRHGDYALWDRNAPWEHDYSDGPLPIIDNNVLSFINTGSDLIYAGATLARLSGDNKPLLWATRLARRYDEIRHEATGLGGYQFNHREPCRVRISFKKPLSERPEVNETTVLTNGVIQTRYGRVALTLLNLFEELGTTDGQVFLDIACKDLMAIGKHTYDPADQTFSPVLNDGTKLFPSDCMEGVGYCSPRGLEKVPASGLMFLVYAKAYHITGDRFFWRMARSLAQGIGLRGIFDATDDKSANLQVETRHAVSLHKATLSREVSSSKNHNNVCILLGLLELYKTTGQSEYLSLAINFGDQLAQKCFADGFFTTGAEVVSIDNPLPLALLHLAATAEGKHVNLPTFYPNSTSFDPKVIIARRRKT